MEVPDGLAGMGGKGFYQPADALSVERAITSSRKRKALYEAGKYRPINYGVFVARRDVLRWVRSRNLDARVADEAASLPDRDAETAAAGDQLG